MGEIFGKLLNDREENLLALRGYLMLLCNYEANLTTKPDNLT
jgi:hypothetical protein